MKSYQFLFSTLVFNSKKVEEFEKELNDLSLKASSSIISELRAFNKYTKSVLEFFEGTIRQIKQKETLQEIEQIISVLRQTISNPALRKHLITFEAFLSGLPDKNVNSIRSNTGYDAAWLKKAGPLITEISAIIADIAALPDKLNALEATIAQKNSTALPTPSLPMRLH